MLVKFAPTKILSNLQENKKNCLVVVGKEPIQISAVKMTSISHVKMIQ